MFLRPLPPNLFPLFFFTSRRRSTAFFFVVGVSFSRLWLTVDPHLSLQSCYLLELSNVVVILQRVLGAITHLFVDRRLKSAMTPATCDVQQRRMGDSKVDPLMAI